MDLNPNTEVAEAGFALAGLVIGAGLSLLAGLLQRRQPGVSQPRADDVVSTVSSRGSFVPLVIGRYRVGANVGWLGDRDVEIRTVRGPRRYGLFGPRERIEVGREYFESGWHRLCTGPATTLHAIYANGEPIWTGPIHSENTPSGTTIDAGDAGSFEIYWGELDQPVNSYLGRGDRIGIQSRWPHVAYVLWRRKSLGPTPQWQQLEYDVECRCPGNTLLQSDYWLDGEGVNPAHAIYQVLTAPFPHGIGMPASEIDMDSLERLGVLMQEENLPLNMAATDGAEAEAILQAIMQDAGVLMSQIGGRLAFYPIRPPMEGDYYDIIPYFDADTIEGPLPEIEVKHADTRVDRVVFTFRNRDRNYRDFDLKVDDDGHAELAGAHKTQRITIDMVTDRLAAQRIAMRRLQGEVGDQAAVRFTALRDGRLLHAGQLIEIEGVGRVRVLGVTLNDSSSSVRVEGVLDSYSLPAVDDDFGEGIGDIEILTPEPDLAFTWFTAPEIIVGEPNLIMVFRTRAHNQIDGATIHVSVGGDYFEIGDQDSPAAGGILLEPIIEGETTIEEGPIIEAQDDSWDRVLDLSGSGTAWENGLQLCAIGNEIMFLREVEQQAEPDWEPETAYDVGDAVVPAGVPTGMRYVCVTAGTSGESEPGWPFRRGEQIEDGTAEWEARFFRYQLKGLIRGEFDTPDEAHAADDWVYVIEQSRLALMTHPIIQFGETLCVKTRPQVGSQVVDLSEVTEVCKIVGEEES